MRKVWVLLCMALCVGGGVASHAVVAHAGASPAVARMAWMGKGKSIHL
jgi:hypothetical protein